MAITNNPLWKASKGLRGTVLKQLVFKQYKDRTIVTKYPDMSAVIPTELQVKANITFADAVKFAKDIISDPEKKRHIKQMKD